MDLARIETQLEELESLDDPAARDKAIEAVQALLEFYGEGLTRFVATVADHDDGALAEAVVADELVSHMLLLHGLHPVPVEERVREALSGVAPYLLSHGGGVELVEVREGIARLRLEGSCSGCPSSRVTLKLAVEDAVMKAAPELLGIEADGVAEGVAGSNGNGNGDGLLHIEMAVPPSASAPGWAPVGPAREVTGAGPQVRDIRGEPVLFLRFGGEDYAYRPRCPACDASLTGRDLDGGEIACGACGERFDVRRAGMSTTSPVHQLEPVPLLVGADGQLTVALGAAH